MTIDWLIDINKRCIHCLIDIAENRPFKVAPLEQKNGFLRFWRKRQKRKAIKLQTQNIANVARRRVRNSINQKTSDKGLPPTLLPPPTRREEEESERASARSCGTSESHAPSCGTSAVTSVVIHLRVSSTDSDRSLMDCVLFGRGGIYSAATKNALYIYTSERKYEGTHILSVEKRT